LGVLEWHGWSNRRSPPFPSSPFHRSVGSSHQTLAAPYILITVVDSQMSPFRDPSSLILIFLLFQSTSASHHERTSTNRFVAVTLAKIFDTVSHVGITGIDVCPRSLLLAQRTPSSAALCTNATRPSTPSYAAIETTQHVSFTTKVQPSTPFAAAPPPPSGMQSLPSPSLAPLAPLYMDSVATKAADNELLASQVCATNYCVTTNSWTRASYGMGRATKCLILIRR
jgi:hypothetical protein